MAADELGLVLLSCGSLLFYYITFSQFEVQSSNLLFVLLLMALRGISPKLIKDTLEQELPSINSCIRARLKLIATMATIRTDMGASL